MDAECRRMDEREPNGRKRRKVENPQKRGPKPKLDPSQVDPGRSGNPRVHVPIPREHFELVHSLGGLWASEVLVREALKINSTPNYSEGGQ